jgi:hypothetical protein
MADEFGFNPFKTYTDSATNLPLSVTSALEDEGKKSIPRGHGYSASRSTHDANRCSKPSILDEEAVQHMLLNKICNTKEEAELFLSDPDIYEQVKSAASSSKKKPCTASIRTLPTGSCLRRIDEDFEDYSDGNKNVISLDDSQNSDCQIIEEGDTKLYSISSSKPIDIIGPAKPFLVNDLIDPDIEFQELTSPRKKMKFDGDSLRSILAVNY